MVHTTNQYPIPGSQKLATCLPVQYQKSEFFWQSNLRLSSSWIHHDWYCKAEWNQACEESILSPSLQWFYRLNDSFSLSRHDDGHSLGQQITSYLLIYWTTPHTTTVVLPCKHFVEELESISSYLTVDDLWRINKFKRSSPMIKNSHNWRSGMVRNSYSGLYWESSTNTELWHRRVKKITCRVDQIKG